MMMNSIARDCCYIQNKHVPPHSLTMLSDGYMPVAVIHEKKRKTDKVDLDFRIERRGMVYIQSREVRLGAVSSNGCHVCMQSTTHSNYLYTFSKYQLNVHRRTFSDCIVSTCNVCVTDSGAVLFATHDGDHLMCATQASATKLFKLGMSAAHTSDHSAGIAYGELSKLACVVTRSSRIIIGTVFPQNNICVKLQTMSPISMWNDTHHVACSHDSKWICTLGVAMDADEVKSVVRLYSIDHDVIGALCSGEMPEPYMCAGAMKLAAQACGSDNEIDHNRTSYIGNIRYMPCMHAFVVVTGPDIFTVDINSREICAETMDVSHTIPVAGPVVSGTQVSMFSGSIHIGALHLTFTPSNVVRLWWRSMAVTLTAIGRRKRRLWLPTEILLLIFDEFILPQ